MAGKCLSLLCLIDLSKCFDVIDHDLLIRKMTWYGIDVTWFTAYLGGHTQSVSLRDRQGNTATSKPLDNGMGVFQGSALGPLLFTIFANDMAQFSAGADVLQYADDTQVLITGKKSDLPTLISRLELSLASLAKWFRANYLKVNASKTQLIMFGSHKNLRSIPKFKVTFCDMVLEPCNEVKNLGVTFDPTMSWDRHVSLVCQNCVGTLVGLSHARHLLPSGVITTLVSALVLSQVRYCLSVYGNGTKKNMIRIQKIINFGARVIFGRRKFDPVADLHERLGWLPAPDLTDLCTLSLANKVLRHGEPDSLSSAFTINRELRDRNTRQDDHIHVPRSNASAGKRRFCARVPVAYNRLPADLRDLDPRSFITAVKDHLKNHPSGERHWLVATAHFGIGYQSFRRDYLIVELHNNNVETSRACLGLVSFRILVRLQLAHRVGLLTRALAASPCPPWSNPPKLVISNYSPYEAILQSLLFLFHTY